MIKDIAAAVREEPGVSVQDAKRELLEFGEQQSRELHETIESWHDRVNGTLETWHTRLNETVESWQTRIKHAAPYAAAAAAGVGFMMGKRRPKRHRDDAEPEPEHRSAKSMAVGWMLRTLGPMAIEMLTKMRSKHHQPHPDNDECETRDQPPPAV